MDQKTIDGFFPMKDPDERIAVIGTARHCEDLTRKVCDFYVKPELKKHFRHIGTDTMSASRLRGVTWSKVVLLNHPDINCNRPLGDALDHLQERGIPIIEVDDRCL